MVNAAVTMDSKPKPSEAASPFADLLKNIVRKAKPSRKASKGRRLAQSVLDAELGALAAQASVASVKSGVVTLETGSSSFFQELEGYHKERLLMALRKAGLEVRELRVKLSR